MDTIKNLSEELGKALHSKNWLSTTAESCTGGGIASAITAIAGSSQWFDRGFVTYSNEAKQGLLGVSSHLIEQEGAVSQEVAEAMAVGALKNSSAQISVSVTGIAGPDGGTLEKPVGTVWLGWALAGKSPVTQLFNFDGDRQAVREQSIIAALKGLLDLCQDTA